jgi:hypothetical protein
VIVSGNVLKSFSPAATDLRVNVFGSFCEPARFSQSLKSVNASGLKTAPARFDPSESLMPG